MIEKTDNTTIFKKLIGQGLWSLDEAPEHAQCLRERLGMTEALKVAFEEQTQALQNGNTAVAIFWSTVQDCLNPHVVKLLQ